MLKKLLAVIFLCVATSGVTKFGAEAIAEPDAIAAFYHKTPINIIVSSPPGGGYDNDARLLSRYFSRYIPGSPTIIIKNMPGAAGSVAANYVYNVAPKDGATIVMPQNTLTIDQFTSSSDVQFDMRKFSWLGSMDVNQSVCIFSSKTGKIEGADFLKKAFVVGASGGVKASPSLVPKLLNQLAGTKFEIINGYEGSNVLLLAMQRGEVQGLCGIGWDSVKTQIGSLIKDGSIQVALDVGRDRASDLKKAGVPFLLDLVPEGEAKDALELIMSVQVYGRPFGVPPGVPPARVAALREAFEKTMQDPQFRAEADRLNIELQPLNGDQVLQSINAAFSSPSAVRDRALRELKKAGW